MNSPFPGMDPYLEDPAVWEEFHHVFVTECMYFLSERLPEGYVAKIGERVELIGLNDEAARQYVPDTAVALGRGRQQELRTTTEPAAEPAATTATLVADPITIPAVNSVDVREGYVEILRMPGHDLVTSIELLSPWNKYGEGIGEYRHKRRALVGRGVHVVEIDLLRRGTTTELARPLPGGITTPSCSGPTAGPTSASTPGGCATPSRRSACPCGGRTPTWRWSWRPWSAPFTTGPVTHGS